MKFNVNLCFYREPTLGPYRPVWKPYTYESPGYLILDSEEFKFNYKKHELDFWRTLLPSLSELTYIKVTNSPSSTRPPLIITANPSNRPVSK